MTPKPSNRDATKRMRVLFAAGNGDVAGTLKQWRQGRTDNRIIAKAYSSEIYDIAKEKGWRLFCFPNNTSTGARSEQIAVFPLPKNNASGLHYFISEYIYGRKIAKLAGRLEADAIICSTGMHTLGFLGLSSFRGPIVISLHNTFWTRCGSPPGGMKGLLLRLPARRLGRHIGRVVAVSEEIRRQVIQYWRLEATCVKVHIPQYDQQGMPWTDQATSKPYRILFAGRAEANKGIDDIIGAAGIVEQEHPGLCRWIIAGDGSALEAHRAHAARVGTDHLIDFLGQIHREMLSEEIRKCQLTITPTRPSFNEGLAKLPLEGAIMGRPAIASTVVPALDLLGEAAIAVEPSNPRDIADAVIRLCTDPNEYTRRRTACRRIREMTDNHSLGFQCLISEAIDALLNDKKYV